MARMSHKYASQPNDSNIWWWLWIITDLWYIGELKFYFQTRHCISAGALLFLGGKTLHEITWFYEDKINIWNLSSKTTSNCVSLTSGTLLHSQERPFLYKKAFLEVGSSITYLPFTKHCLAKNLSSTIGIIFTSVQFHKWDGKHKAWTFISLTGKS